VSVTARQLVGREEELGAIFELLDARERLPGVTVLAGEAGIGKTTLWLAGLDAAAGRGYRILSWRPISAGALGKVDCYGRLLRDVRRHELNVNLEPVSRGSGGAGLR
jgi:hypothetical protein